jgi:hypothetical protein
VSITAGARACEDKENDDNSNDLATIDYILEISDKYKKIEVASEARIEGGVVSHASSPMA